MYHDTITLFNRYKSRLGDMWCPTILHDVDLNTDRAATFAKYGEESADAASLHVKYVYTGGEITVAGKQYLSPKEWERQTNDQLPGTITFTPGDKFDFFYAGVWNGTEPIQDETYLDGFYDYMNARYDHVYAITSVTQYSVIPHFEIVAK